MSMVLNPRLLYLLRTLIQTQLQKVLLPVRVLTLLLLLTALLRPAPRIGLVRPMGTLKSVASTGHATIMPPQGLSHTMMMTSMIVQREKQLRKVEQALLTSIPFQFEIVKMHRAFARQSLLRRHPLLSL